MYNLTFSVANNVVTHLGRNLYSTTPPALAELVANSYDAYATEVNIRLSSTSISIIDNGKGLDLEGLKNKYVIIGSEKKVELPINGLPERKPMGKKGIGKLAAFSLGNVYTVYSKSVNKNCWLTFKLNYQNMTNQGEYSVEVKETNLPQEFSEFEKYPSGFIVNITDIRRSITESTKNNIRKQLSRRFYVSQSKTNFNLKIDGQQLKLDSNVYYDKIEYLVYFGYEDGEVDDLKNKFRNIKEFKKYSKDEAISSYFSNKNISGWIGTTKKPKDLKNDDGGSFANVIVLANGKIADEDILKTKPNARLANNYIVGEIVADRFISNLDDPITSSRQGLDDSIPDVGELIKNLDIIRSYVIDSWDEMRRSNAVENLPMRIKANESYKNWLSSLTEEQKTINNKLLDLFANKLDDDISLDESAVDSMVTSISSVINNIEADDLISSFEEETDTNVQTNLLLKLMKNIAKTEDLNHANLIRKRLSAIEELERLMRETNTPEKIFEEHLSENPWLIMPYWNIDRNNSSETEYLRKQVYFRVKTEENNFKKNFIDILIKVAEEKYPIIVELKKNIATGHARVTFSDIYDQIKKYRKAMIQNIPKLEKVAESEIKVFFILSEDTGVSGSGNSIELNENEIKMLKDISITILKYNEILVEAKKIYQEHIKYHRMAKLIPDLSQ